MTLTFRPTTRSLLMGILFACPACTYSPGYVGTTADPRNIQISAVSEDGPNDIFAFDFEQPQSSRFSPYGLETAGGIKFGDRNVIREPGHVSLIGLYGEITPNTWSASDPYDGGRNLSQISFAEEGASFDPDIDFTGKWLVFASTRHRDTSDIYLKSTVGKTITQLTSDPADDLMPSFAPTGDRIAFASNRSGNWNIYVCSLDAGPAIQITDSPDDELHPSWSPDGRMVAYCKLGSQSGRWEIWVVEFSKPGIHRFLDYGLFPQFNPDVSKNKILFQRSRQRGSRYHSIWTLDYINGEAMYPTEIVSSANAAVINPSWSPDGNRIAFTTVVDPNEDDGSTPTQSDVWVVNLDGTNRTMLTSGQFANFHPVWSRHGAVYFVSNRSGMENIWAISTKNLRNLNDTNDRSLVNVDSGLVGPPYRP